jgi:hypothetical protein
VSPHSPEGSGLCYGSIICPIITPFQLLSLGKWIRFISSRQPCTIRSMVPQNANYANWRRHDTRHEAASSPDIRGMLSHVQFLVACLTHHRSESLSTRPWRPFRTIADDSVGTRDSTLCCEKTATRMMRCLFSHRFLRSEQDY